MLGIELFQPFAAKSECSKILVDNTEQLSCSIGSDRFLVLIEFLHVMAAIYIFPHVTFSGRSEGLNSVLLTFLHLVLIWTLNDRHALSSVNLIPLYAVATKVLNCSNAVGFSLDFDFIRLHSLLDCFTDLTESGIDTRMTDAGVRRVFDGFKKVIIGRVERNCKGAVRHDSSNVAAIIDLHNVILLQDSLISDIRCPVSSAVVETCASREGYTRIQATCLD